MVKQTTVTAAILIRRGYARRTVSRILLVRMANPANMLTRQAVRRFMTSAIRRSGHDLYDGVPGHNLPFSTHNRYRLLATFMIFFGSGFSVPFWMVRHHLLK